MELLYIKNYIREHFKIVFATLKFTKKILNPLLPDMSHITKYASYGKENPDKTFYIIRWGKPVSGFGGMVNTVIAGIIYALDKNWIPVVDFKNYENCYLPKEKVGTTNVWEWFYEQPCGYTVEDIKKSKNIRLSPLGGWMGKYPNIKDIYNKTEDSVLWRSIYKKYIRLNEKTTQIFSQRRSKIIADTDKVLAIKLRGTDYASGIGGHPKAVCVEESLLEINEMLERADYDKIFLSCEDESLTEKIRQVFGSKLVMNETAFKKLEENEQIIRTGLDKYQDLEEYMSTLWIASQCQGVYGVACGGTIMIWYMSDENMADFKIKFIGINENRI